MARTIKLSEVEYTAVLKLLNSQCGDYALASAYEKFENAPITRKAKRTKALKPAEITDQEASALKQIIQKQLKK
jgi:hypothetical protein